MTSFIGLCELVYLNGLLFDQRVNHVVKELNIVEALALKSSIFAVQKAAAPKNGVEFCQGSDGTISRRRATLPAICTVKSTAAV